MTYKEDVSVVQFATALSPTITLLQIATVLCAGELQGLRLFLGWPFHCPALNTLRESPKGSTLPLMVPVIFAQNAEPI